MITVRRGWSKPSTILFATEVPPNEKAFACALAQGKELNAELILMHVGNADKPSALDPGSAKSTPDFAMARAVKQELEPLISRARDLNVHCRVVVRTGNAADEILRFSAEHKVDRLVLGVHTPGPVGKLLVGSVAEAVLRKACAPVLIVGPYLSEAAIRNTDCRTILCPIGKHPSGPLVARLAAEMAVQHGARLVLQQIVPPQVAPQAFAGRSLSEIGTEMLEMVPHDLRGKISVTARVMEGDPTEELLYQSRVLKANLIVMGAPGASHFAAVTHACAIYKALAYAHCPVMTLSPVLLAGCEPLRPLSEPADVRYIAGVV
ncbi:MAG TPA: universal stress protein [Terracidiphilus sp.]|nr:universal stress protein [Terracidiphilus sp.]